MNSIYLPTPEQTRFMDTMNIRKNFLLENLFVPGQVNLAYAHTDRMIVGGIVPGAQPLSLEAGKELAADYFAERREIGIFCSGGQGMIKVDGTAYDIAKYDMLYIGQGSREITFHSHDASAPARFFLISVPAHMAYPTTLIKQADAREVPLGSADTVNERVIYQYIHTEGVQSCQLVMGFTQMHAGNVWNTMPPHTHDRRSEIYMYFDLEDDAIVFHLMGQPQETRHIVMRDGDAVISPSWSIHAGVGTKHYAFVWAMGGENKEFSDMDGVTLKELR